MISALTRIVDNLFGRGEAAVTVPPLDGAMRPNEALDQATSRWPLDGVDCLAVHDSGVLAAAGATLHAFDAAAGWTVRHAYASPIACMAAMEAGGLAVALDSGEIRIEGGRFDGRAVRVDPGASCITAMAASGATLFVANGSASNRVGDWQRDLLERNASGSIWRVDLESGSSSRLAGGLAWPAGLALDGGRLIVAEAWRHRLVRLDPSAAGRLEIVHADLPGYPGRLSPAADGYWLAMFAPRSQLVEFILREPAYRRRMMAEVPHAYWVVPRLRSGRSFYESLQGGGVKHLGILKPWAPTMSAGLCVKLDAGFQPRASLQSRADGHTHGVTSVVEHGGKVIVAARGDGVVVALSLTDLMADEGGAA